MSRTPASLLPLRPSYSQSCCIFKRTVGQLAPWIDLNLLRTASAAWRKFDYKHKSLFVSCLLSVPSLGLGLWVSSGQLNTNFICLLQGRVARGRGWRGAVLSYALSWQADRTQRFQLRLQLLRLGSVALQSDEQQQQQPPPCLDWQLYLPALPSPGCSPPSLLLTWLTFAYFCNSAQSLLDFAFAVAFGSGSGYGFASGSGSGSAPASVWHVGISSFHTPLLLPQPLLLLLLPLPATLWCGGSSSGERGGRSLVAYVSKL